MLHLMVSSIRPFLKFLFYYTFDFFTQSNLTMFILFTYWSLWLKFSFGIFIENNFYIHLKFIFFFSFTLIFPLTINKKTRTWIGVLTAWKTRAKWENFLRNKKKIKNVHLSLVVMLQIFTRGNVIGKTAMVVVNEINTQFYTHIVWVDHMLWCFFCCSIF
jgi:hypothetical protein